VNIRLPDAAATEALAAALARALPADYRGYTLLLEGELGAGKSTLARALIRRLGAAGPVPSPTYTLVEPYSLPGGTVYHVDLYRVADPDELEFLGWDELDDGLRIVEWPEHAPELERAADLRLRLRYSGSGRAADVEALSARGHAILAAVASAVPTHASH
jgi:tRNA threonylcarbamoyladenosine biosynthesis protein TsaE